GGVERFGPERAEEGRGVVRGGALFGVVRLRDQAAAVGPVFLQRQDEVLEVHKWGKNALFRGGFQRKPSVMSRDRGRRTWFPGCFSAGIRFVARSAGGAGAARTGA